MTLRLRVLAAIPPSLLRPFVVRRLLHDVADAFDVRPPTARRMAGNELLATYASFSNARAKLLVLGRGDPDVVGRRLWRSAHRVGTRLRRGLGIRTGAEAMAAARAVYRALDIDLRGSSSGDVVVARCSFSRVYAPEVCAVMWSLDAGLFAGLTDGRRLTFSRRLTEGAPTCLATLRPLGGTVG